MLFLTTADSIPDITNNLSFQSRDDENFEELCCEVNCDDKRNSDGRDSLLICIIIILFLYGLLLFFIMFNICSYVIR